MKNSLIAALASLVALAAGADPLPESGKAPPAADKPLVTLPYTPGLAVASMDRTADPCVDFYQYSCGGWIKNNPIPPDQARWSVYGKLYQENQQFLWGILEQLAKQTTGRSATQQKIGDYFAACMDEASVEKRGTRPLTPYLERIAAMRSSQDLPAVLAFLHLSVATDGLLFDFSSNQDFADSQSIIAFASAGGLGLPDPAYYTKTDAKSVDLRSAYTAHVQRMFELLGEKAAVAKQHAATVIAMETALAKASLTRVEQRDPYKLFHKMDLAGLTALTPHFAWSGYLQAIGLPAQKTFNVTEPEFYKAVDQTLTSRSLDDLKVYLRWHLVSASAPFLTTAFVQARFNFYSKRLRGVPALQPRWKRCVSLVDDQLGEALGEEFVRRTFSPALKEKTNLMTRQIEAAMEQDLKTLDWMSETTRQQALTKLHAIVNKIGYPNRWRDYSSIAIDRSDFFGNVERATRFEARRSLGKIGKPLDRTEWIMTPPTVNAGYDPQLNDITFPAGVLQPPLYDPKMDDAPNYGNTGGTIGHELTHGFDDEGRQFDARGNLKDWWTAADAKRFEERAQCVVDQYAQYTIVDDIKINSKLTEGEDVADLGGLVLAWSAWQAQTKLVKPESRDGLTPEQRFFVGYAQWACESNRPENLRVGAVTDPHSPAKYRVNGLVVNMPEFARTFACKAGQPMTKKKPCRVW